MKHHPQCQAIVANCSEEYRECPCDYCLCDCERIHEVLEAAVLRVMAQCHAGRHSATFWREWVETRLCRWCESAIAAIRGEETK